VRAEPRFPGSLPMVWATPWTRSSPCCARTCPTRSWPAEALPPLERALRIHEAAYGPDHPDVAIDLNYVGRALADLGRPAEALSLQQRALRIREAAYGPDHPDVAVDLNYMGRALSDLGRSAEALPLHERALRIHEATYGPDHPATCQSRQQVEELEPSS
jgi:tetratricopeptide (TPR) repeat protein